MRIVLDRNGRQRFMKGMFRAYHRDESLILTRCHNYELSQSYETIGVGGGGEVFQ